MLKEKKTDAVGQRADGPLVWKCVTEIEKHLPRLPLYLRKFSSREVLVYLFASGPSPLPLSHYFKGPLSLSSSLLFFYTSSTPFIKTKNNKATRPLPSQHISHLRTHIPLSSSSCLGGGRVAFRAQALLGNILRKLSQIRKTTSPPTMLSVLDRTPAYICPLFPPPLLRWCKHSFFPCLHFLVFPFLSVRLFTTFHSRSSTVRVYDDFLLNCFMAPRSFDTWRPQSSRYDPQANRTTRDRNADVLLAVESGALTAVVEVHLAVEIGALHAVEIGALTAVEIGALLAVVNVAPVLLDMLNQCLEPMTVGVGKPSSLCKSRRLSLSLRSLISCKQEKATVSQEEKG